MAKEEKPAKYKITVDLQCGACAAIMHTHEGEPLPKFCAGCGAGLFAGIASSLLRPADPTGPGGIFVDRVLHGASDVLNPDKGA